MRRLLLAERLLQHRQRLADERAAQHLVRRARELDLSAFDEGDPEFRQHFRRAVLDGHSASPPSFPPPPRPSSSPRFTVTHFIAASAALPRSASLAPSSGFSIMRRSRVKAESTRASNGTEASNTGGAGRAGATVAASIMPRSRVKAESTRASNGTEASNTGGAGRAGATVAACPFVAGLWTASYSRVTAAAWRTTASRSTSDGSPTWTTARRGRPGRRFMAASRASDCTLPARRGSPPEY